jgi:hypothetical protein
MAISRQWQVFKELLITDLTIFMRGFADKVINIIIWTTLTLFVSAYLMPEFGVSSSYGSFMLASVAASVGSFELFPNIVTLVNDLEGPNILSYYFTLPLPSWLVLVRSMVYYALTSSILSAIVLALGAPIISSFNIATVNVLQLIAMILLSGLFYGAFTLWVASFIKNMLKIDSVWMRFVFPVWFLGGFQFSWKALYQVSPFMGIVNLFNPIMYAMEGFRIALLGFQASSLMFWQCCLALIVAIIVCAWWSLVRFKKRLDFV